MAIVIGGGPIGMMSAKELATKGYAVKVLEEHKRVGEPVQCTGIVTKDISKIIKINKNIIINKLRKTRVFSKNNEAEFRVNDLVIDRSRFDRQIADEAKGAGAEIETRQKVKSISLNRNNISVETDNKRYVCKNLIGADGPLSLVRKTISKDNKLKCLPGIQYTVKGEFNEDCYDVYLGDVAKGFFAWVVPESKKKARIGLATNKSPAQSMKKLCKKLKIEKKNIVAQQGGLIPIYNPRLKTQSKNMYIVGDAAGQVKASTGGGLVPGLKVAKILAHSIANGRDYEKAWKKEIGKEIWLHLKIREMLDRFSDKEYDELVKDLSSPAIKKILAKHNRDNIYSMLFSLGIRKPSLSKYLIKLF